MALLALLLLGGMRVWREAGLPQQRLAREQAQALALVRRVLERLRDDVLAGRPLPATAGEEEVTAFLLDHADFQDDLRDFAGGVKRVGNGLLPPLRAFLTVGPAAMTVSAGAALARAGGGCGELVRLRLRLAWGRGPVHGLLLQTVVWRAP